MQLLKTLFDLGPLVIFFGVYALSDGDQAFFTATAAFMAATVTALIASKIILKKIPVMPLVTGVLVMIFGGLTLYLKDETFLKLKPTMVYILFAALLLGGLALGRTFLKLLFDEVIHLTDEGWYHLTIRWGLFFLGMALVNEIVWRNFSTSTWVSFKLFGFLPLTMLFAISQIGFMNRHMIPNDEKKDPG